MSRMRRRPTALDHRLRLMRWALTRATARYSPGGRLKVQGAPRPITLAAQPRTDQELETGAAAGTMDGLRRPSFRPRRCSACDRYWADPPSHLCPGCQAYQEHHA